MRTAVGALVVFFAALTATHSASADGSSSDLASILDHVDDLYVQKSAHTTSTMHVVTEHTTRDMNVEAWSKAPDRFLIKILSPEKDAGTLTLKSGSNVWNYFPRINQVTKISASLMGAGWMGSHVTNSDLVKHVRTSEHYKYQKTFEGDRGGEKVIEITRDPKPNAPVVWGRVVVTARSSDKNPTTVKYYDEGKALVQTWTFSDVKKLGGSAIPTTIRIVPASKPSEVTEVRYHTAEFNVSLADDTFSMRTLQK